jgi:hypothetical protein
MTNRLCVNRLCVMLTTWLVAVAVTPSRAGAGDVLADVRDLYRDAFYERALTVIEQIGTASPLTPTDAQAIRRYKALCLIALERMDDAVRVTDEIVRADPMMDPDPSDPPRLRDLIHDARVRVLPGIVRERYTRGRAQLEQKAYAEAARDFEFVVMVLDDSSVGLSGSPELADLALVARGALDVIRLAAAQTPAAAPTPAAPMKTSEPPADATAEVVPPVVIQQRVPPWPPSLRPWLAQAREGMIEVVVGVDGRVESARIVTTVHPQYDGLLLAAAKTWRYRPALRNGAPVRQSKMISVMVTTSSEPANR